MHLSEHNIERLVYLEQVLKSLIQLLTDDYPAVSIVPDFHTENTEEYWKVWFSNEQYAAGCTPLAAVENAVRKYNGA